MLAINMLKMRRAAPPVTVSMSPGNQSDVGSVTSKTFPNETITVSGGTPTSYTWGFVNTSSGTWSIVSGQGTASAAPRVSGVVVGEAASATFYCDVVVGGVTYRTTATLDYSRQ